MENKKFKLKKSKAKESEIEMGVEILPEILAEHRKFVLADIRKDFSLSGFRKGNVPENLVLKNISADRLLHEAADSVLRELYPKIIEESKISPVSRPEINITKLALGNPLEIKIRVAVYPEVDLPNYKKIGKKIWDEREKPAVEDEEVENTTLEFRKMRQIGGGKDELPELTDEEVKQFGKFENVADFKAKLKKNMLHEKEADINKRAHDKMVRNIVAESKLTLAPLLLDEEQRNFLADFEGRLKDSGETLERYLARVKKNPEEVGKEQRDYVERSLKTKFVLSAILEKEKLEIPEEIVEREAKILKNYRQDMTPDAARAYAKSWLLNEKLFEFLEGSPS
jgi:trigger factor